MARTKYTTKSVEGRNRLLRETNINVLEMVRMRDFYLKQMYEALNGVILTMLTSCGGGHLR